MRFIICSNDVLKKDRITKMNNAAVGQQGQQQHHPPGSSGSTTSPSPPTVQQQQQAAASLSLSSSPPPIPMSPSAVTVAMAATLPSSSSSSQSTPPASLHNIAALGGASTGSAAASVMPLHSSFASPQIHQQYSLSGANAAAASFPLPLSMTGSLDQGSPTVITTQSAAPSPSASIGPSRSISIILPGEKKPKPIPVKRPDIKADVVSKIGILFSTQIIKFIVYFHLKFKDVVKLIHKNKEEQNPILDLSKNNVRIFF